MIKYLHASAARIAPKSGPKTYDGKYAMKLGSTVPDLMIATNGMLTKATHGFKQAPVKGAVHRMQKYMYVITLTTASTVSD